MQGEKLRIGEGYDSDGPSLDNNFVPSIHVVDEDGNLYCVGLRYGGGSSLDIESYSPDHVNFRLSKSKEFDNIVSLSDMEKLLKKSGLSYEDLINEFVSRLKNI